MIHLSRLMFVTLCVAATGDNQVSPASASNDVLRDVAFANACGPIACYAAARRLGTACTLEGLVAGCAWKPGEMTSLRKMQQALSALEDVRVTPTRLSPTELRTLIGTGDYTAILPIRKASDHINHAVCVVADDQGLFRLVDYPELVSWKSADEIADMWDGQALLISLRPPLPAWKQGLLAVAPSMIAALAIVLPRRGVAPRKQVSTA